MTNSDALPGPEQVRTYRKKPVMIEAMLVYGYTEKTKEQLTEWLRAKGAGELLRWERGTMRDYIRVRTLNGWVEVTPPEYVIVGVAGEVYPCKPDIFEETYELVPERPRD